MEVHGDVVPMTVIAGTIGLEVTVVAGATAVAVAHIMETTHTTEATHTMETTIALTAEAQEITTLAAHRQ